MNIKKLNKLEIEEYLSGWMDNVGAPYGIRIAVITAFNNKESLQDWFGVTAVEYDSDYALDYSYRNFPEYTK